MFQSPFKMFTVLCGLLLPWFVVAQEKQPRMAVITTVWYHNSHADVIAGRLLLGHTLDGKPPLSSLRLASLYVDQKPANDKSAALQEKFGFPVFPSIKEALTLGGEKLAVEGVLLIAEHGKYPESETGSIQYPKRRMFAEIFRVFEESGRVVPIFSDKHLSDNWTDIDWIVSNAVRLKIPLMAGSSLPGLWRYPTANVVRGAPLKELVLTSYHRLDAYGFHALESMQVLAEQRQGGETGIKQVRCLEGDAVWQAMDNGLFDEKLLTAAVEKFKERPLPAGKKVRDLEKKPILFHIEYQDGLKASIITLHGSFVEWTAAWRDAEEKTVATCFWTQEARPFMHFSYQLQGVEQMMKSGKPTWPVERTILTSAVLDALLQSRKQAGAILPTPQLAIRYQPTWEWQPPPEPPTSRPLQGE